jgi:predicted house-cleaning noncanonical NTP pyrophosphatase (MazG superfamily)
MKSYKLVRDNIPEIMKNQGKSPICQIANEAEYGELLKNKLLEEVDEFLESGSTEELADILEVVHAICIFKKITYEDLEKERLVKLKKRGGFAQRIVLEDK